MSFNKIILVGNLGKDPELRYTPQGDAVCNLSVATNEKRKGKDGEYNDVTTWFRVTLWRRQAENASKYLQKGSSVFLEGRMRIEEWTDRDGNNRYTIEVDGTDMQFLGGGGGGQQRERDDDDKAFDGISEPHRTSFSGPATTGFTRPAVADDDIPF